jgi:hypothetical protein
MRRCPLQVVPDASELEVAHVRVMLAISGPLEVRRRRPPAPAGRPALGSARLPHLSHPCSHPCSQPPSSNPPQPPTPATPRQPPQPSYREFRDGLDLHRRIQAAVRRNKDPSEVMQRLFDYLFDNEQVLRKVFCEFDSDADGQLSHGELHSAVTLIPGLEPNEQKFIMAALYQADRAGDGTMDFDTLLRCVF